MSDGFWIFLGLLTIAAMLEELILVLQETLEVWKKKEGIEEKKKSSIIIRTLKKLGIIKREER